MKEKIKDALIDVIMALDPYLLGAFFGISGGIVGAIIFNAINSI